MKNKSIRYMIITVLAPIPFSLISQDKIAFKVIYKPETIYQTSMEMSMSMKAVEEEKEAGTAEMGEDPIAELNNLSLFTSVQSEIYTGSQNPDGKFPVTLKANFSFDSPFEMITDSITIEGRMNPSGFESIDTINAGNSQALTAMTSIKQYFEQYDLVKYPEIALAVGDTFIMKPPLSIPGLTDFMDMKANSVYTMSQIDQNHAYFQSKETFNMEMIHDKKRIAHITGVGAGNHVFDTQQNHFIQSIVSYTFTNTIVFDLKTTKIEYILFLKTNTDIKSR